MRISVGFDQGKSAFLSGKQLLLGRGVCIVNDLVSTPIDIERVTNVDIFWGYLLILDSLECLSLGLYVNDLN